MRTIVMALGCCLVNLAAGPAQGQAAAESVKPLKQNVYALVAAVGERFSFVVEVLNTGSHLDHYRRSSTAAGNLLNSLVLQGLDKAIAKIDHESTRIYMTLPAAQQDRGCHARLLGVQAR